MGGSVVCEGGLDVCIGGWTRTELRQTGTTVAVTMPEKVWAGRCVCVWGGGEGGWGGVAISCMCWWGERGQS